MLRVCPINLGYIRLNPQIALHLITENYLISLLRTLPVQQRLLVQCIISKWGHAVAQSVEALRYKSEGRGLDSRWCHWNFSLT